MKKVHHAPDYAKNRDADIIKKGSGRAIPGEQWEMSVGKSVFPQFEEQGSADAWLPQPAKKRATPHLKVNECDH